MSKYVIDDSKLTAIANAIREKTGKTSLLTVDGMIEGICAITIPDNSVEVADYTNILNLSTTTLRENYYWSPSNNNWTTPIGNTGAIGTSVVCAIPSGAVRIRIKNASFLGNGTSGAGTQVLLSNDANSGFSAYERWGNIDGVDENGHSYIDIDNSNGYSYCTFVLNGSIDTDWSVLTINEPIVTVLVENETTGVTQKTFTEDDFHFGGIYGAINDIGAKPGTSIYLEDEVTTYHRCSTDLVYCTNEYPIAITVRNVGKYKIHFFNRTTWVGETSGMISTSTDNVVSLYTGTEEVTHIKILLGLTTEAYETISGMLSNFTITGYESSIDISATYADMPTTLAQSMCLARARQMRDIVYTPLAPLPYNGGTYPAGEEVKGLPYSSVRIRDKFIGFNVSIHTFMTALNNPKSDLYNKIAIDGNIATTWYGTNCSEFVSYAYDLNYLHVTSTIPTIEFFEAIEPKDMRICDCANSTAVAHAILITGIERNIYGDIQKVTITNSDGIKVSSRTMEYSAFVNDFIEAQSYQVYRNKNLYKASYKAIPYIPLDNEPTESIVYSDLNTNLGDKATILTTESITLNPLVADGYTAIKLYKDGAEVGSYDVADITLSNLSSGKYTAFLYPFAENASTSFIVAEATASRSGNRYYFSGDGTPMCVVFKRDGGYTIHRVDLTEKDVAKGYKDIDYVDDRIVTICVPFKNEYGFNVVNFEY